MTLIKSVATTLILTLTVNSATSQSYKPDIPPPADVIDDNGLAYQAQTYVFASSGVQLPTGGNNGVLRHSYTYRSPGFSDESTLYSFVYVPFPTRASNPASYVFDGKSITFEYNGIRTYPEKKGYSQSSNSNLQRSLTTPDGTIYNFGNNGLSYDITQWPTQTGYNSTLALSEKIFPDGEKWTYTYQAKKNSQMPVLRQVQSSLGPTIVLNYVNLNTFPTGGTLSIKPKLSYSQAFNASGLAGCTIGSGYICAPNVNAISETYSRDGEGRVSKISNNVGEFVNLGWTKFTTEGIKFDVIESVNDSLGNLIVRNSYSDNTSNNFNSASSCMARFRLDRQEFADSSYKQYTVRVENNVKSITVDNSGVTNRLVQFTCFNQGTEVNDGPTLIRNENQDITRVAYDIYGRVEKITQPEENGKSYEYDARGNILVETIFPKPSSGLTPIKSFRTYFEPRDVVLCADKIRCNKITTQTDQRGYRRDWAWTSKGQIAELKIGLNSLGDCVEATVCAKTSWSYIDKQTANGTISLVSAITYNAGTATELTKQYSYDSNINYFQSSETTSSNGILLRKCFMYNGSGNITRAIQPNANLTSCPLR